MTREFLEICIIQFYCKLQDTCHISILSIYAQDMLNIAKGLGIVKQILSFVMVTLYVLTESFRISEFVH